MTMKNYPLPKYEVKIRWTMTTLFPGSSMAPNIWQFLERTPFKLCSFTIYLYVNIPLLPSNGQQNTGRRKHTDSEICTMWHFSDKFLCSLWTQHACKHTYHKKISLPTTQKLVETALIIQQSNCKGKP